MEIDDHHPNENKQAIYSELALARESATIAYIWQIFKGSQGHGELSNEKGKNFR